MRRHLGPLARFDQYYIQWSRIDIRRLLQHQFLRHRNLFWQWGGGRNGETGLEFPNLGTQRSLTHVANPSTSIMDTLNGSLYPDFLRERFVPPRHQVVTEETDRELAKTAEKDLEKLSSAAPLAKTPNANDDEKEGARSMLNELAPFELVGLASSRARSGKESTIANGNRRFYVRRLRAAMHSGALLSEYR